MFTLRATATSSRCSYSIADADAEPVDTSRLGCALAAADGGNPARVAADDTDSRFVDYLLFVDEAPLPGRIRGTSGSRNASNRKARAIGAVAPLRDLDLDGRLMRYPCSYDLRSGIRCPAARGPGTPSIAAWRCSLARNKRSSISDSHSRIGARSSTFSAIRSQTCPLCLRDAGAEKRQNGGLRSDGRTQPRARRPQQRVREPPRRMRTWRLVTRADHSGRGRARLRVGEQRLPHWRAYAAITSSSMPAQKGAALRCASEAVGSRFRRAAATAALMHRIARNVPAADLVAARQRAEIDVGRQRRPRRMQLHAPDLLAFGLPGISNRTCVRMRRSNAGSKFAARLRRRRSPRRCSDSSSCSSTLTTVFDSR